MKRDHPLHSRRREAFSLLELMIVIIIISLAYGLVFSSMGKREQAPRALEAGNLKSTLFEQGLYHHRSELFCLDKCQRCYLYRDGETSQYEGKLALGDIEIYTMGSNRKLEKLDFGRFQDHPVCLRFKLYENGSSSKMVIKSDRGIYYIPAMFGKTIKTASLEEAEAYWNRHRASFTDNGEIY